MFTALWPALSTPARPLFTSLPGGAVSHMLQVRTTAGGRPGERWAGRQES